MFEKRSHFLVPSEYLAPAQDPNDRLGNKVRDRQAQTEALRCPMLSRAGQSGLLPSAG